jgi:hypothetical protein
MFKTLLTAALSVFLLTSANAADLTKLNNLVDRTNIMVNSGCSGTILDSVESLILTANHCIDQQYETVTREEIGSDGEVTEKEVRIAVPGVIHQFEFDGEGVIAKTISHRMEIVGLMFLLLRLLVRTPVVEKMFTSSAILGASCIPLSSEEMSHLWTGHMKPFS